MIQLRRPRNDVSDGTIRHWGFEEQKTKRIWVLMYRGNRTTSREIHPLATVTVLPGPLIPGDSETIMLRLCPKCSGFKTDFDSRTENATCRRCWGRGYIDLDPSVCFRCCGSRKQFDIDLGWVECTACRGTGRIELPDYL